MLRIPVLLIALGIGGTVSALAQADVHVRPSDPSGTLALQQATAAAAVRNYLQAWQGFRSAFEQNHADLLDRDFTGTAKEKLAQTVKQQAALGIRTIYQDRSHDLQIVFYSPDGLSLELVDNVAYDLQVIDHDKKSGIYHVKTGYVTVMTPAETKWLVRVFEAIPQ